MPTFSRRPMLVFDRHQARSFRAERTQSRFPRLPVFRDGTNPIAVSKGVEIVRRNEANSESKSNGRQELRYLRTSARSLVRQSQNAPVHRSRGTPRPLPPGRHDGTNPIVICTQRRKSDQAIELLTLSPGPSIATSLNPGLPSSYNARQGRVITQARTTSSE